MATGTRKRIPRRIKVWVCRQCGYWQQSPYHHGHQNIRQDERATWHDQPLTHIYYRVEETEER